MRPKYKIEPSGLLDLDTVRERVAGPMDNYSWNVLHPKPALVESYARLLWRGEPVEFSRWKVQPIVDDGKVWYEILMTDAPTSEHVWYRVGMLQSSRPCCMRGITSYENRASRDIRSMMEVVHMPLRQQRRRHLGYNTPADPVDDRPLVVHKVVTCSASRPHKEEE